MHSIYKSVLPTIFYHEWELICPKRLKKQDQNRLLEDPEQSMQSNNHSIRISLQELKNLALFSYVIFPILGKGVVDALIGKR